MQNKRQLRNQTERRRNDERLWRLFEINPSERNHETLWRRYQPLVCFVAERFNERSGGSNELLVLINAGNVGLLDAISEYELACGLRFETMAITLIREAIARSLAVQCLRKRRQERRLEITDAMVAAFSPLREERLQSSDPLAFPRELGLIQLREHLRRYAQKHP